MESSCKGLLNLRIDRRISRACIEALEARQLLSATLENGLLTVEGSDQNDAIVIMVKGPRRGYMAVDVNGDMAMFRQRDVRHIRVDGKAGDDQVDYKSARGRRLLEMARSAGLDTLNVAGSGTALRGLSIEANDDRAVFAGRKLTWASAAGGESDGWTVQRISRSVISSALTIGSASADDGDVLPPPAEQLPFLGVPFKADQTIQAEDFDLGGEGAGYHDVDSVNRFGIYRANDAVDILDCGDIDGGFAVGAIRAGEWLEYTVDATAGGPYDFALRYSSDAGVGASMHVEVDGVDVSGSISLRGTGSWYRWRTISQPIDMSAGLHTVRLVMDENGSDGYVANLNWFRLNTTVPVAPESAEAFVNSSTAVTVAWSNTSANESGYQIERKVGARGVWTLLTTVGADVTTYVDASLAELTAYYYRVRAFNGAGVSAYATAGSARTVANLPDAPTNLSASAVDHERIQLVWTDNAINETGYYIDRRTIDGQWERAASLRADTTGWMSQHLSPFTQYVYRVRAYNSTGETGWTNQASAMTDPVYIVPGEGFTGPTTQPAAIGTPDQAGYDAKAIARWDVVPYQTFTSDFAVGIPAFHMNGIDRVEFSVDGGPWMAVREMTLNPQTNVVEYWTMLKASEFTTDGAVEVRAVVYPVVGIPRVLQGEAIAANGEQSLLLWANANLTLASPIAHVSPAGSDSAGDGSLANPYQTVAAAGNALLNLYGSANGATIYLAEGDYAAWSGPDWASQRWMTVTGAPGTDPTKVRLVSMGRTGTRLTRLRNLTIVPAAATTVFEGFSDGTRRSIWLDHMTVSGPGRYEQQRSVFNLYDLYNTDTSWLNTTNGPTGAVFVRGVTVRTISSDAFSNVQFVVNSTVDDIDPGATGAHPDVYQIYSPSGSMDNYIVYGLDATNVVSQGLFVGLLAPGQSVTNTAFVNVSTSYREDVVSVKMAHQWGISAKHVVFDNLNVINHAWLWRTATAFENVVMRNSTIQTMASSGVSAQEVQAAVCFYNCRILSTGTFDFVNLLD